MKTSGFPGIEKGNRSQIRQNLFASIFYRIQKIFPLFAVCFLTEGRLLYMVDSINGIIFFTIHFLKLLRGQLTFSYCHQDIDL